MSSKIHEANDYGHKFGSWQACHNTVHVRNLREVGAKLKVTTQPLLTSMFELRGITPPYVL
jgi:hypothetical protein